MRKVYLDNAATTALSPKVLEKMMPYLTDIYGNASSPHSFGQTARIGVEHAREQVARAINADPSEIVPKATIPCFSALRKDMPRRATI